MEHIETIDACNSAFRSYVYTVICSAMHNCHIRRIDNFSNGSEALKDIERGII